MTELGGTGDVAHTSRQAGDGRTSRRRMPGPDVAARHRGAAMRRRDRETDRVSLAGLAALDPFDDAGMSRVRRWMQNEIDRGRDPERLRAEIATRLWPWARDLAGRATRRLPPYADHAEIHSAVAVALWQCCAAFDPEPSPSWAAWLQIRLRGAVIDAIRVSDQLSRRDRRKLRDGDLEAPPVEFHALDTDLPADRPAVDPERAVIDGAVARELRNWMDDDLPEAVARRLELWWRSTGATTSLPASLAADIAPYRFRLADAVELLR